MELEHKFCRLGAEVTVAEGSRIEGYASVFGACDQGGDVVAAGAIFECTRRGLSVPGEIAVAGWGDYDIGRQLSPSLTTIAPFSDEIGLATVAALLEGTGPGLVRTRFALELRESA